MRRTIASALWTGPVLFLTLLILAAGQARPDRHDVSITVDASTGDFSYSRVDSTMSVLGAADTIQAKRGDKIYWYSDQGDWAVDFGENTPFAKALLRGQRAGPDFMVVRGNAEHRAYKYTVTVVIGEESYQDDPVIVVGPD